MPFHALPSFSVCLQLLVRLFHFITFQSGLLQFGCQAHFHFLSIGPLQAGAWPYMTSLLLTGPALY